MRVKLPPCRGGARGHPASWTAGRSRRTSPRSGCTWPPRASPRTIGGYTWAVRWFAAAWLLPQAGRTSWDQVDAQDVQRWMVHVLSRYSSAYAGIQFRALRQFFNGWPPRRTSLTRWTGSARPR